MMLAYIDPGLGTLLWQSIIAMFVGLLFYLKKTRRWIMNMFRKMFGRVRKAETAAAETAIIPEKLAPKVESKTEAR